MKKELNDIELRDKKHLWHPLIQHKLKPNSLAIERAENCILYDFEGKQYIDGIASWYTCMYGHCNPYIIKKVQEQMTKLDQIVFSGFTHRPAVELSEALIEILPKGQNRIFFSDNGSTSVDIAIKMSLQYFHNKGVNKNKVICFEDAFHGDTFGAMSVSGLSVYNGAFEQYLLTVERIDVPTEKNKEQVLSKFVELIKKEDICIFIYEPLVQGAAAMKMHKASLLDELLKIAKEHGVICIADEVMTGFGKTGTNFASDHIETKPDIICLSKSLTAGLVPMAITSCSEEIYLAFYDDQIKKGFFHGHTYSANPIACTAALSAIELLKTKEIQDNIKFINKSHNLFLEKLKGNNKVKNLRCIGVIMAFELNMEMDRYGNIRDRLFNFFMDRGVFIRPLGNTLYLLPPFTISEKQLAKLYDTLTLCIQEFV